MSIRYKGILCAAAIGAMVMGAGEAEAKKAPKSAMDGLKDLIYLSDGQYFPKTPPNKKWTPGDVYLRIKIKGSIPDRKENGKAELDKQEVYYDYLICNLFPGAHHEIDEEAFVNEASKEISKKSSVDATFPFFSALIGLGRQSNNVYQYKATIGHITTYDVDVNEPYNLTRDECKADSDCVDHYHKQVGKLSYDRCLAKINKRLAKLSGSEKKNIFLVKKIAVADRFTIDFWQNPKEGASNVETPAGDKVQNITSEDSVNPAAEPASTLVTPNTIDDALSDMAKIVAGARDIFSWSNSTNAEKLKNALGLTSNHVETKVTSPTNASATDPKSTSEPTVGKQAAAETASEQESLDCGVRWAGGIGISLIKARASKSACIIAHNKIGFSTPMVIGYVPYYYPELLKSDSFQLDASSTTINTKAIPFEEFEKLEGATLTPELMALLESGG